MAIWVPSGENTGWRRGGGPDKDQARWVGRLRQIDAMRLAGLDLDHDERGEPSSSSVTYAISEPSGEMSIPVHQ